MALNRTECLSPIPDPGAVLQPELPPLRAEPFEPARDEGPHGQALRRPRARDVDVGDAHHRAHQAPLDHRAVPRAVRRVPAAGRAGTEGLSFGWVEGREVQTGLPQFCQYS